MPEVELLKVIITVAAVIASATAVIYTRVLYKSPKSWTLIGITAMLWGVAIEFWGQRVVMYWVEDITSPRVALMRSAFLVITIIGLLFFLYGTYNSGNNRPKK